MAVFTIKATSNDNGRQLLKVVIGYLNNVPMSRIQSLFRKKDIKVNGVRNNQRDYVVQEGDFIEIFGIEAGKKRDTYNIVDIKFGSTIYEDENILIINKPAKVSMSDSPDSLDEQVKYYLKFKKTDSFIPASIGRLDKLTTGLVVYAKNSQTLRQLNEQKNMTKIYVYRSNIEFNYEPRKIKFWHMYNPREGVQKAELFKEEVEGSKEAITILFDIDQRHYAQLVTGRKHQIRATLSKLGHPIYGDKIYGGRPDKFVYLHSYKIKFHDLEGDLSYLNNQEFLVEPKW